MNKKESNFGLYFCRLSLHIKVKFQFQVVVGQNMTQMSCIYCTKEDT